MRRDLSYETDSGPENETDKTVIIWDLAYYFLSSYFIIPQPAYYFLSSYFIDLVHPVHNFLDLFMDFESIFT